MNQKFLWCAKEPPDLTSSIEEFSMDTGSLYQVSLEWDESLDGISKTMTLRLFKQMPILMWRLSVVNNGDGPIYLDKATMLQTESHDRQNIHASIPLAQARTDFDHRGSMGFDYANAEFAFFSNGWQSWNYCGTLSAKDRYPKSWLGPLVMPMRMNMAGPQPSGRGHHISDMFGVLGDRSSRIGLLLGFVSQKESYGSLESWLDHTDPPLRLSTQLDGVQLNAGDSFQTDWAYLQYIHLDENEPLADYLDIVATQNHALNTNQPRSGWCSWYYAYGDVSEQFMIQNLEWTASQRSRLPLELFQLDDGYQKIVGDWFDLTDTFPGGLQAISSKIAEAGMIPGIWLAPFVAKRASNIGKEHPDWILRNRMGIPVNPGFIFDSFPYVLDVTHHAVLDHLEAVVDRIVSEMGYEYLKLDFLYAAALPGNRFDQRLTRAQGLRNALQRIRRASGDVELLGCGIPLGSGIGVFEHMRIGPDVAPHWKPKHWGIEGILDHEKGLPSARNALLTTINRMPMHRRWWMNDPDCLIIRSSKSSLTEAEVQTLASVIAMSGGAMIVSDHLPDLTRERVDWLSKLIPPLPHAARAVDWFDTAYPSKLIIELNGEIGDWWLICLINWDDRSKALNLDTAHFGLSYEAGFHTVDYWNQQYHRLEASTLQFPHVGAHGVRVLAIRPAMPGPQWLGDSLHFSQGRLVKGLDHQTGMVRYNLLAQRRVDGNVWLGVPGELQSLQQDGSEVEFSREEHGIYRCYIEFEGETQIVGSY